MGQSLGVAVGCGVTFGRGVEPSGPNGVASGWTGKAEFGVSLVLSSGGGVTIAILPLGCALTMASVFAGSTEPAPSTKFFP